jgi:putative endonuclease
MEKGGYIYIMTNKHKRTLYIGVTSNFQRRVEEHRIHHDPYSFTARYNLEYCIYYERFEDIEQAIIREKQLKGWSRAKKEAMINAANPEWNDLAPVVIPTGAHEARGRGVEETPTTTRLRDGGRVGDSSLRSK